MSEITKIVIAGEGGQGVQTISKILSLALIEARYNVSYIPQFGPEQRGTPSVSFLQFFEGEITYPKFDTADLVVVLRKRALPTVKRFIGRKTTIIFDSSTIGRKQFDQSNSKLIAVPATKIANEMFLPKTQNLIVLSFVAKNYLEYPKNALWEIASKELGKKFVKDQNLEKVSKEAFDWGYDFKPEKKVFSRPIFDTSNKIVVRINSKRTGIVIPDYCKGCGICISKCPVKALSFSETLGVYGTRIPEIDIEKCITCGNCERFCPDSAIKVEKK